jgi:hypothetical protein
MSKTTKKPAVTVSAVSSPKEEPVTFPLSDREQRIRDQELSELVERIMSTIKDAEKFADKYHLSFSLSLAGSHTWYEGDPEVGEDGGLMGWQNSSSNC